MQDNLLSTTDIELQFDLYKSVLTRSSHDVKIYQDLLKIEKDLIHILKNDRDDYSYEHKIRTAIEELKQFTEDISAYMNKESVEALKDCINKIEKLVESMKSGVKEAVVTDTRKKPRFYFVITINNSGVSEDITLNSISAAQTKFDELKIYPPDDCVSIELNKIDNITDEVELLDSFYFNQNEIDEDINSDIDGEEENSPDAETSASNDGLKEAAMKMFCYANDFKYIHWNYRGDDFDTIHSISEEFESKFRTITDTLMEIVLESEKLAPHPSLFLTKTNCAPLAFNEEITKEEIIHYIDMVLGNAIECLTEARKYQTEDIISLIDDDIRYLKLEKDFKNACRK